MSMDYEKIKRLITLVEQNQLTELAVEEDGFSVTIKAESAQTTIITPAVQHGAHVETHAIEMEVAEAEVEELVEVEPAGNVVEIRSPMIGVFYRKPSPDSPNFIEIGDEIEEGQTVGLIEAMKVFSEVPSEIAGRVLAVPVENGKLVQAGDILVVVDVSQI